MFRKYRICCVFTCAYFGERKETTFLCVNILVTLFNRILFVIHVTSYLIALYTSSGRSDGIRYESNRFGESFRCDFNTDVRRLSPRYRVADVIEASYQRNALFLTIGAILVSSSHEAKIIRDDDGKRVSRRLTTAIASTAAQRRPTPCGCLAGHRRPPQGSSPLCVVIFPKPDFQAALCVSPLVCSSLNGYTPICLPELQNLRQGDPVVPFDRSRLKKPPR